MHGGLIKAVESERFVSLCIKSCAIFDHNYVLVFCVVDDAFVMNYGCDLSKSRYVFPYTESGEEIVEWDRFASSTTRLL